MSKTTLIFFATLLFAIASPLHAKKQDAKSDQEAPQEVSLAVYLLQQLQEREKIAFEKYETAVSEEDIDQIKRELQSVINGYDKLVTDSPDYAPAYVAYGLILNRTGNREESYSMFLKADELDPMIPVVKNQLGNYMAEEGKYMEAYGFFLLARDLDPTQSLYYYQLGNVLLAYRDYYMQEGLFADDQELDRAIQANFREAMINSPSDVSLKMRYAQSFFDIEDPDWEAALEIWQELYGQAGSEYEQQIIRLYTARVRYELGHYRAARKLLKQVDHPSLDESKQIIADELNAKYPE